MWFGTQDGLCRFDGYKFKIFRNEQGKNSISNNYIWQIYEDKEGNFWIATFGGGLNKFDPAAESFTHYKNETGNSNTLSSNNIFSVLEVDNTLWIGTNDGFCSLDKSTGHINRYLQTPGNDRDIAGNFIGSIVWQKPGFLWMNSDSGLTRFDMKTKRKEFFGKKIFDSPVSVKGITRIRSINNIFLVTCDTGLVEINVESKKVNVIIPGASVKAERKISFTDVVIAPDGKYWLCTNQGLLVFDRNTGQHSLYRHDNDEPGSLIYNNVLCIYRSASGIVWVGTRNGLDKLDHEKNQFALVRHKPGNPNTLSHRNVSGIVEDNEGFIWTGSSDGLNVLDPHTKNITVFKSKPGNSNSLSSNYILSLLIDEEENIWIGTSGGGLTKASKMRSNSIEDVKFSQFRLNNKTIQHICAGDNDILWLGSSGSGLIRFNKRTGETKDYPWKQDGSGPSHPYVFYVFKDSFGNIWLGTATGGLNIFDPASEKFIYIKNSAGNFNSLSNNMVLTIFEGMDHRLWIGTAGGLNKLTLPLRPGMFDYFRSRKEPDKDSLFTRFDNHSGLINDVIYGILQDNKKRLWVSTNGGLANFDPEKKQSEYKVYNVNDGMQDNEFNQNAFFENDKGEFYFGGVNGYNIFHPDSLEDNKYIPPVVITDFRLYNVSVPVGKKNKHNLSLTSAAPYTDRIRLAYHHDVITFEFAALNYINTEKNQYQYKLDGFDKDWIPAGENRFATYTNLDAGKYIFRVKASNNDGVWNEEGASIHLIVPPPPWLSWYAILGYFLLASFGIYYFIRQREKVAKRKFEANAAIEKAKAEERESFRKKSSQDFHDEAGNKITRINLYTELAKSEAGSNQRLENYLEKIYQNTAELSAGMRDFIWTLDPEKDTVADTMLRLKEFGDSMFIDTSTAFTLQGLDRNLNDIKLPIDARRAILQVFKEAMNNCVKHAKATTIVLATAVSGNRLEISLKDNGSGFDNTNGKMHNGYGLRIMKERAEKAGAGLVISSNKEKGTGITMHYNIPHMRD